MAEGERQLLQAVLRPAHACHDTLTPKMNQQINVKKYDFRKEQRQMIHTFLFPFSFENGLAIAQAELWFTVILLPQPPNGWDYIGTHYQPQLLLNYSTQNLGLT